MIGKGLSLHSSFSKRFVDTVTELRDFVKKRVTTFICGPAEADPEYQLIVRANNLAADIDHEMATVHKYALSTGLIACHVCQVSLMCPHVSDVTHVLCVPLLSYVSHVFLMCSSCVSHVFLMYFSCVRCYVLSCVIMWNPLFSLPHL